MPRAKHALGLKLGQVPPHLSSSNPLASMHRRGLLLRQTEASWPCSLTTAACRTQQQHLTLHVSFAFTLTNPTSCLTPTHPVIS